MGTPNMRTERRGTANANVTPAFRVNLPSFQTVLLFSLVAILSVILVLQVVSMPF